VGAVPSSSPSYRGSDQDAAERSRAHTIVKWASISMAGVLVILGAGVAYVYKTAVGDVKHTVLLPVGVTQDALPPDPYGDTAMNILLIGSATRDSAGDCMRRSSCASRRIGRMRP
jgi:hypothetical protein